MALSAMSLHSRSFVSAVLGLTFALLAVHGGDSQAQAVQVGRRAKGHHARGQGHHQRHKAGLWRKFKAPLAPLGALPSQRTTALKRKGAAEGAAAADATASAVTAAVNVRLRQQRSFRYFGGNVLSQPIHVALVFLGTWQPCASTVLGDLMESLDTHSSSLGALPPVVVRGSRGTGFVRSGTVTGWWKTVAKYTQGAGAAAANATAQINYLGSYLYPDVLKVTPETVAKVSADIKDPKSYFAPLSAAPATKARTVLVFLLGGGAVSPLGPKKGPIQSPVFCAAATYQSSRFPGFLGAVLVNGPGSVDWNPNCDWTLRVASSIEVASANGCSQGDTVATHILAKLADLVTSPGQFAGDSLFLGKVSPSVTPSYSCAQNVVLTRKKAQYGNMAGLLPCTGASMCDLRLEPALQVIPTATSLLTDAPLRSSEATALSENSFFLDELSGVDPKTKKTVMRFANVFSQKFQFFIQPYWNLKSCTMYSL